MMKQRIKNRNNPESLKWVQKDNQQDTHAADINNTVSTK